MSQVTSNDGTTIAYDTGEEVMNQQTMQETSIPRSLTMTHPFQSTKHWQQMTLGLPRKSEVNL
jgi:hypothetical protein